MNPTQHNPNPPEPQNPPARWIAHVDMDAFFASVEVLDNPSLRGKPVIVGHGARGVVCAASYEARVFGVRSAIPMTRALQLCPQGEFIVPRHGRYSEVSRQVMAVLRDFSPMVEQASIDEAYLEATGLEGLFGPVQALGEAMKRAVFERTGLTCSVGFAPVKFLAKIASDLQKPDGLSILYPEQIPAFLRKLPVARIPGVGERTLASLRALGVSTAGDVGCYPADFWERRLGKVGMMIWERSQGIDRAVVEPYLAPKSEGAEDTLLTDTRDREVLNAWLLRQAEEVGARARKHKAHGRTVTLKVKFSDFRQITRSRTLAVSTASTRVIYETAAALLDNLDLPQPVRLIGLSLSGFVWGVEEQRLALPGLGVEVPAVCNDQESHDRALDEAIDEIRARFGKDAVLRGTFKES